MSSIPGLMSKPGSLSASASGTTKLGGEPGSSISTPAVLAWPSVMLLALQSSGWKFAAITMGTALSSLAPQSAVACLNAFIRCWPTVVPVFPATGVAGVVSLNPSPGGSRFWMVKVAVARAIAGVPSAAASTSAAEARRLTAHLAPPAAVGSRGRSAASSRRVAAPACGCGRGSCAGRCDVPRWRSPPARATAPAARPRRAPPLPGAHAPASPASWRRNRPPPRATRAPMQRRSTPSSRVGPRSRQDSEPRPEKRRTPLPSQAKPISCGKASHILCARRSTDCDTPLVVRHLPRNAWIVALFPVCLAGVGWPRKAAAAPARTPTLSAPACSDVTSSQNSPGTQKVFAARHCQGGGVTWDALLEVLAARQGVVESVDVPPAGWTGEVSILDGATLFSIDDEGDAARFCAASPELVATMRREVARLNTDADALTRTMGAAKDRKSVV